MTNGGPPTVDEQGPLPSRPLLAPWLRTAVRGRELLLEYGDAIVGFEGEAAIALLPTLLPLLDGTRTIGAVAVEAGARRADVTGAVELLAAHGLLLDGPPVADETALLCAAVAATGAAPAAAARRLESARIVVAGAGAIAAACTRLLKGSVRIDLAVPGRELESAALALAAPAPAELHLLEQWNERLLELRTPWLQALPFNGRFAAIGPLYLPGETCCHGCYRTRRAAALGDADEFVALGRQPAPYPVGEPLATAIGALAALVAVRWLATAEPSLPGTLWALELGDGLRMARHRVHRVPRCPACSGSFRLAPPLPWAEAASG